MTHTRLRISEYRACTLCLGTEAAVPPRSPVTGAAADEHNLNVVDCDASVTVPRLVLKWGSGAGNFFTQLCPGSTKLWEAAQ